MLLMIKRSHFSLSWLILLEHSYHETFIKIFTPLHITDSKLSCPQLFNPFSTTYMAIHSFIRCSLSVYTKWFLTPSHSTILGSTGRTGIAHLPSSLVGMCSYFQQGGGCLKLTWLTSWPSFKSVPGNVQESKGGQCCTDHITYRVSNGVHRYGASTI